jgi:hypothetical protein
MLGVFIVLGTFAYCVNQRGDLTRPRELYKGVDTLVWRHRLLETPWGYGLLQRPVVSTHYNDEYVALRRHLEELSAGPRSVLSTSRSDEEP